MNWKAVRAWFRYEPKLRQLILPFYCGYYGEECDYTHKVVWTPDMGFVKPGFYGICRNCGVEYEPGCDR